MRAMTRREEKINTWRISAKKSKGRRQLSRPRNVGSVLLVQNMDKWRVQVNTAINVHIP
jgi:hypothetical protein